MRKIGKLVRIVYAHLPGFKSGRSGLSGAFRFAKDRPNLQMLPVYPDNRSIVNMTYREMPWDQIEELKPDGIIFNLPLDLLPDADVRKKLHPVRYASIYLPASMLQQLHFPFDVTGLLNDREIVHAATDLACRRGFRNFAYVDTLLCSELERSDLRAQLYGKSLTHSGFTLHRLKQNAAGNFSDNLHQLAEWLKTLPKPCMVFAYADDRARTVIDACHLAHLDIPGQVNVIGIDNDSDICESTRPTLTSIQPDFELSGYLCAQALYRVIMSGRKPKKPVTFTCGVRAVVERESTQDLRGGGRLVTRAQEIIRESFSDPKLRTPDIAARLGVSRQLLDLRFREIVGRTVHDEIEHLRIEKARTLIEGGYHTINETLNACGYANANTFRNAFKSVTGRTPSAVARHEAPQPTHRKKSTGTA